MIAIESNDESYWWKHFLTIFEKRFVEHITERSFFFDEIRRWIIDEDLLLIAPLSRRMESGWGGGSGGMGGMMMPALPDLSQIFSTIMSLKGTDISNFFSGIFLLEPAKVLLICRSKKTC